MKIQGYDEWKLASPPEVEMENRKLDIKIEIELHKDDVDNFIAWVKDNLVIPDIREEESDSEDEGYYAFSVYGEWAYEHNSDIDAELEIESLQSTLMEYKCNYVEVEEN